ncbi:transglycosylase SLT domain-containing protein [Aliivibrio fischeri]|uniref:Peptidoglycan lytic exotransglycosylase n=1 Tax=Aliivibrio fischeri TaxID=668 RepID=A0A510UHA6_ALIFS|nr:transporter substrate-binding domain-containing protein [Aliivibrio fischeri]GEK12345.1 peptidoglycan lytic exotransglycosylase [Aliivibrio fischeri]
MLKVLINLFIFFSLTFMITTISQFIFVPEVIYLGSTNDKFKKNTLEQIKKRGFLLVATKLDGVGCYYKRGQLRGIECELLQEYANYLDVELNIIFFPDLHSLFTALENKSVDIIASDLTPNNERKKKFLFSNALFHTEEWLIQRKDNAISNLKQLNGKTISIRKGTTYRDVILALQQEMNINIKVELLPETLSTLEIIKGVANGFWSYTLADQHIVQNQHAQYPKLSPPLIIGQPREISLALFKDDKELLLHLNSWLANKKIKAILNKKKQSITPWDNVFKKNASPPFDWLWLTSQAFAESSFDPNAISSSGAKGLMQLMPETAKDMGVTQIFDPKENIKGGAKYNKWLYKTYWNYLPEKEALAFTFASYNAGVGHVMDAQRLALRNGDDPNIWFDNVENHIIKLEKKSIYTLQYIKYGYCRGSETKDYVRKIFSQKEIYSNNKNTNY